MDFLDWVSEAHPETLMADGLDDAVIGGVKIDGVFRLIYNADRVIEILMSRDGMDYESAWEFAEFNIFCAYVGPGTPAFFTSRALEDKFAD